jgi:hypothetical protein
MKIFSDYVKIFSTDGALHEGKWWGTGGKSVVKWLKLRTVARRWCAGAKYGWLEKRGAQRTVVRTGER